MKKFISSILVILMAISLAGGPALTVSADSTYTVEAGDSLWKIAKEKLGDGLRFSEIFEANKDQIKNPDRINIGQVLSIPDEAENLTPENESGNESGSKPAEATPQANASKPNASETNVKDDSIYIVYTNDIHTYIYNTKTKKDADGNEVKKDGLRISSISKLVSDMRADGKNVLLVDAGDEIQGSVYGNYDRGKTVIELMNKAGYQLATPGNHDFDYGVDRFNEVRNEADFPYISCNFKSNKSRERFINGTHIFEVGAKKIAFIGITTPETITSSRPANFQDETGEYIYTVDGLKDAKDLYVSVQSAIDSVKDEADYVIALGHLGVNKTSQNNKISSLDVIKNTTGLNAFIDGHSHTTLPGENISDKSGKDVLLTQTGAYLDAVGLMQISGDGIKTELINEYEGKDAKIAAIEDKIFNEVETQMGEKLAGLETTLYIFNPENEKQRLIRATELNAGDFVADSMYWYLNEKAGLNCDAVIMNAGGVRAQINAGDFTTKDLASILPFGNVICLVEATGQNIKDALECGVTVVGQWDEEWDSPEENPAFMHVAGLKYTIDTSVTSSVKRDENNMFKSVEGDYRVKDIEIYNKKTGKYEAIDLKKTYTLGGINYMLMEAGDGINMFKDNKLIVDFVGMDIDIAKAYVESFAKDGSLPFINSKNSPLSAYKNYLLDYENPYGAGRILILQN